MIRRWNSVALVLAALAMLAGLGVGPASAASDALFGPRIGISSSPDQLVLGGQVEFPEFAEHLTVDPNLELGFLDHVTTVAINGDFLYHFQIRDTQWTPYAGLGLGLVVTQFDRDVFGPVDSETDVGANLILGAGVPTRSGSRFFTELRAGLGDLPQLKIMAGWNFRM
ncbi:MAG TPA: hypothetical protein VL123_05250 [Candidatus Udaeobacter sp.]|jgi:hypothetical protein|nr:hypothetical protein [Candidatus Udaeobacter sp.]